MNTDSYIITPLFLMLLMGSLIGILTFFFLLRFRNTPGVKYWQIWQVATSFWAFTYAFEFAATDLETKIMWSKFSYFGIVYCTIAFFLFSLEISAKYNLLKNKYVIPLFAIATFFLLSPFTNELHHLHWKSYSINPQNNATNYVYGPFFWIIFGFSYLALTSGIINIGLLFFRLSGFYKRQIALLFFASLLPPLGNLIYVFHINPEPGFDWTPFTFLITGILVAINISRFKMFDLVPFARNTLIDIIPDAILVIDKSLRIADFNPAMRKLISPDKKDLIGQRIEKVMPLHEHRIREVIDHKESRSEISQVVSGEIHYFDMQITSLLDHNNEQNGRLVVLKDITRRVNADEKIKQANIQLTTEIQEKEKLIVDLDAFAHMVAHDLKNMLGVIVSGSGLIKSGIDDMSKEELLEINELVNLSAIKTTHITNELLTLASVRQQEIKLVPVNIKKVIGDSLSRLNNMILEKGAVMSVPENLPEVLGNEAWLEEVWINYISNAIKYGGTPPHIQFGCEILSGNRAKYWIKDNGKGLKKEEMALLFNKYTRLDTLRAEGNGLGLSIVKRIIEKLSGEVGVESQNIPGEGSTFYFILQLVKQAEPENEGII